VDKRKRPLKRSLQTHRDWRKTCSYPSAVHLFWRISDAAILRSGTLRCVVVRRSGGDCTTRYRLNHNPATRVCPVRAKQLLELGDFTNAIELANAEIREHPAIQPAMPSSRVLHDHPSPEREISGISIAVPHVGESEAAKTVNADLNYRTVDGTGRSASPIWCASRSLTGISCSPLRRTSAPAAPWCRGSHWRSREPRPRAPLLDALEADKAAAKPSARSF